MSAKFKGITKKIRPFFKPYRIQYLGLFGSVARGTDKKNSDIDLLVKFRTPPSLIEYIRLEENLSQKLGKKVDLVSMGGVSFELKPFITRDLVTLYENR